MGEHHEHRDEREFKLPEAISMLARELHALASHSQTQSILHRLDQLEKNIMSKIDDLIAAATALSTASDAASVAIDNLTTKTNTLVAHVDAAIAALENADLPAAAEATLTQLKTSSASAAAASTKAAATGDTIDQEVAKVDKVLPTPAPAAPPVS